LLFGKAYSIKPNNVFICQTLRRESVRSLASNTV